MEEEEKPFFYEKVVIFTKKYFFRKNKNYIYSQVGTGLKFENKYRPIHNYDFLKTDFGIYNTIEYGILLGSTIYTSIILYSYFLLNWTPFIWIIFPIFVFYYAKTM